MIGRLVACVIAVILAFIITPYTGADIGGLICFVVGCVLGSAGMSYDEARRCRG